MTRALSALVNGGLLGALLALAVWLLLRFVPRRLWNAATRYALWWAVLAITILLPLVFFPEHRTVSASTPAGHSSVRGPAAIPSLSITPHQVEHPVFAIEAPVDWPIRILTGWSIVSALLMLRLGLSCILLHRISGSAVEISWPHPAIRVIPGEVIWDGEAPTEAVKGRVGVSLTPLLWPGTVNERPGDRSEIPGTFTLKDMTYGEYAVRVMMNVPGLYVKDVRYAGHSVMYQRLRANEAAGSSMQVVIARDGATISARVTNKDGAPLPDVSVLMIPADVSSPAMVQAAMSVGATDQTGLYTSHTIAPGKYYVVATESLIDPTAECIERIWRARTRFTETTVAPSGATQVSLSPVVP
jgi:hypothetical protein